VKREKRVKPNEEPAAATENLADLGADLEEPKEKSQTPTDSFLNWSVQDVNDWVDKAFDKADQDEIKQLKLSGEILSSVREKDLANVSLGTRKRLIEKIQALTGVSHQVKKRKVNEPSGSESTSNITMISKEYRIWIQSRFEQLFGPKKADFTMDDLENFVNDPKLVNYLVHHNVVFNIRE